MNKFNLFNNLVVFILLFSNLVSFSQSVDEPKGCAPHVVNFTAPAGLSNYFWDFGNGGSSQLENPESSYTTPGDYTVTLRESQTGPIIGSVEVEIYAKPVIDIKRESLVGCAPLAVTLTDSSIIDPDISIVSYAWSTGDGGGTPSTTSETFNNTYSNEGNFSVGLILTTNFESCNSGDIISDVVSVISRPVANFTTTPTSLLACTGPLDVTFNNQSSGVLPLSYSWDLGNSVTSTSLNPAPQTYTADGQYTIRLTASYDFGCSTASQKTVSIGSPVASITKSAETNCVNSNVTVSTPVSGARYEWSVNGMTQSRNQSFIPNLPNVGSNDIQLILTSADGSCSDTATTQLIKDDLEVTLSSFNNFSCGSSNTFEYSASSNQDNLQITWTKDNGETFNDSLNRKFEYFYAPDTLYIPSKPEFFNTSITVENAAGCIATTFVTDSLWPLNAGIGSIRDIGANCVPVKVDYSADAESFSNIVSYTFTFPDGTQQESASQFASFTFTEGGEFDVIVEVTDENGCTDEITTITEVGDKLPINFDIEPKTHCWDEPFTLTNLVDSDANYQYLYSGLEDTLPGSLKEVTLMTLSGRNETENTMTVIYNECVNTDSPVIIRNVEGAEAFPSSNFDCDDPLVYNFIGENSVDYTSLQWQIDDINETTNTNFTKDFLTSGSRTITLIAQNDEGCIPHAEEIDIQAVVLDVNITIPNNQVCINTFTQLDASTSEFVSSNYRWTFPSNPNATSKSSLNSDTIFSFNQGGNYNAVVTAQDVNGCVDSANVDFTVYDIRPAVSVDLAKICNPDTVIFTNTSTADLPITNWLFTFADGSTDTSFSTEPSSWSHIYNTDPTTGTNYITSITVTDSLRCREVAPLTVFRYTPTTNIEIINRTSCEGEEVIISAPDFNSEGNSLDFSWVLGSKGTSTSQSNTVIFDESGTEEIRLFVSEQGSSCPGEDTIRAQVIIQKFPEAILSAPAIVDSLMCSPLFVGFTDSTISESPIVSRTWEFSDPDYPDVINNTSTFQIFEKTIDKNNNHIVNLMVSTSHGCTDIATLDFTLIGPLALVEKDKSGKICLGDEVTFTLKDTSDIDTYFWDYKDGIIDSLESPATHQFLTPPTSGDTINVSLVLVGGGIKNCAASFEIPVPIIDVIAKFSINGDTIDGLCFEDALISIQDSSTNADTYEWDFGDGNTSTLPGDKNFSYDTSSTFNIELIVTNNSTNCIDTARKSITIHAIPEIIAINDTACLDSTLQIKIQSPDSHSTYTWLPADGLDDPTSPAPFVTVNSTTEYSVERTDSNGCKNTAQATAFVIDELGIRPLDDTTIVVGDIVKLPVTGSDLRNFVWTPDSLLSCIDCDYPTIQPLDDVSYVLNVTDFLGCFNTDYDYIIKVRPETHVVLPTTFSPNEDGINDIVFVQGWGIKELVSFEIYNRWGELMYTSTDIEEGWNGRYKGDIQNSDAYAYRVVVKDWRDEVQETEGYLNLIH